MTKTPTPTQKSGKTAKPEKARPAPAKAPAGVVPALAEGAAVTAPGGESVSAVSGLEGIPYLGETRRQALALAGMRTQDELRRASVEQIGGVKGVGMVNAARVKEWLEVQSAMPTVAAATPLPVADRSSARLASANQEVQDIFQKLGSAAAHLKRTIPVKTRDKGLDRQLDKLDTVASELAEGPDTLTMNQVQEAVRTLDKIAALLETAAGAEKLTPKKQSALIEELRARRKRLQKTLGD